MIPANAEYVRAGFGSTSFRISSASRAYMCCNTASLNYAEAQGEGMHSVRLMDRVDLISS
jgi:hypothetical protein